MKQEELAALRLLTLSVQHDGGAKLTKEELGLLRSLLAEVEDDVGRRQWNMLVELHATYPTDPSAPGIATSCLGPQQFYAALQRFREPYGGGKEIVYGVKGASFHAVIKGLDKWWCNKTRGGER